VRPLESHRLRTPSLSFTRSLVERCSLLHTVYLPYTCTSILTSKYYWQNSYNDTQEYERSYEICQSTKGSTQLPIGYLTPLNVPTQPWESIAMDFLSIEPVTVSCSELITVYYKLKGEGSHNISFDKLLVISCRHIDYTFLIPCIKELNAKDIIDIFEKWIKSTIFLPYKIITDQDVLFISALFQDWANPVGVRYKASSANHPQTNGDQKERTRLLYLCLLLRS